MISWSLAKSEDQLLITRVHTNVLGMGNVKNFVYDYSLLQSKNITIIDSTKFLLKTEYKCVKMSLNVCKMVKLL